MEREEKAWRRRNGENDGCYTVIPLHHCCFDLSLAQLVITNASEGAQWSLVYMLSNIGNTSCVIHTASITAVLIKEAAKKAYTTSLNSWRGDKVECTHSRC